MAERLCTWCSEPWKRGHACSKPAEFQATVRPAGAAGRPGQARCYALTDAGWRAAGYRPVDGRWVKRGA